MDVEVFLDPEGKWELDIPDVGLCLEKEGNLFKISAKDAYEKGIIGYPFVAYYLSKVWLFFDALGIKEKKFRFLEEDERPFYSLESWDMEVKTSFGWIEVVANNYRGEHDLKGHSKVSKENLMVKVAGRSFYPHVYEISMGTDRIFLALLESAFSTNKEGPYLRLPPYLAPYDVAIFPLIKKEEFLKIARQIKSQFFGLVDVLYMENGSIGRRYAKADEIGVPLAITIDGQTLEDGTVTIRDRDSTEQIRVPIASLVENVLKKVKFRMF